jgi:hypothetical protein
MWTSVMKERTTYKLVVPKIPDSRCHKSENNKTAWLKHLWAYVMPSVGNLTEEEFCVFDISGVSMSSPVVPWIVRCCLWWETFRHALDRFYESSGPWKPCIVPRMRFWSVARVLCEQLTSDADLPLKWGCKPKKRATLVACNDQGLI